MTGFYNSNAFDFLFRSDQHKQIAVLAAEIDNDSTLRQENGQESADRVVRRVADVLRGNFRSEDPICRLKEEKFVIIMANLGSRGRELVSTKIDHINHELKENGEVNMEKVRVGVIGCGRIAQRRHIPEYDAHKRAEIVGYFDNHRSKAEDMARKFGGRIYDSVDELLADPALDAVSVCVANNAHASISIKALESGKHVLVEKPMAMTVADCEAMVDAAKRNGKLLMVAQNQRFNTGHLRAKELIEAGIIGKPLTFKTTFGHGGPERWCAEDDGSGRISTDIWFFDKNIASMGAMADLGIHKTDLIQFLLGERITSVSAKIMTLDKKNSNGEPIELEDNAILIYTMESGVVGTMTVSWTYYGEEDNSTVIFGTKGVMRLYDNSPHTIQINTDRGDHIYYDLDTMMTNENQLNSGVIREFVNSILSGDTANAAGEMEINAIRAILAGFESSREDRTVVL